MQSATTPNLIRVIFRSRASHPWQAGELQALGSSLPDMTQRHSITGIAIYDGQYFLQVIEGTAGDIDVILARIREDERHFDLAERDKPTVRPSLKCRDFQSRKHRASPPHAGRRCRKVKVRRNRGRVRRLSRTGSCHQGDKAGQPGVEGWG